MTDQSNYVSRAAFEMVSAERDRLRAINAELVEALEKIASMENLTFAECSDAEFIIETARTALAKAKAKEGTV